jgi:hypothetical protein
MRARKSFDLTCKSRFRPAIGRSFKLGSISSKARLSIATRPIASMQNVFVCPPKEPQPDVFRELYRLQASGY